MTCDRASWKVTVAVENDAAAGRLLAIMTVDDGAAGSRSWTYASDGEPANAAVVALVNRYSAEGATAEVVGSKSLTGRPLVDGEFSFELAYAAGPQAVVLTARNSGGLVDFGSLSYTTSELTELVDAGLVGSHAYVIREVGAGTKADGVTFDGATFHVSTEVTDAGDSTGDIAALATALLTGASLLLLAATRQRGRC